MERNKRLCKARVSSLLVVIAFVCMGLMGFCLENDEASAAGPTYVSGIISSDTTWTEANSPYIVTDKILVEQNVNLTIEPGVIVKFRNSSSYMRIDGILYAVGTQSKMITFTAEKTTIPEIYSGKKGR